ncbi:MAG: hypothetical protein ACOYEP_03030 [Limnochordia bacterium]
MLIGSLIMLGLGWGLLFMQVIGLIGPGLAVSFLGYILTLPSVIVGLTWLFSLRPPHGD